jgi:hypothetical protein
MDLRNISMFCLILLGLLVPPFLMAQGLNPRITGKQITIQQKMNIGNALNKYDLFILKTNADSIASLFTIDGNLGNMAMGRDSIRKFLLKFKNVKVLSVHTNPSNLIKEGDLFHQTGNYMQTAILPKGDTVQVSGKIDFWWIELTKGVFFIKKVTTIPDKF